MIVLIITTGGTFDKTYSEHTGKLENTHPCVEQLIDQHLRLPDMHIAYKHLFNKDSLDMQDSDFEAVLKQVRASVHFYEAIIIIHGTDLMATTANLLLQNLPSPPCPIVLTGSMTPASCQRSDALQNLTESFMTARLKPPGVYISFHSQVFTPPDVEKDYQEKTFKKL